MINNNNSHKHQEHRQHVYFFIPSSNAYLLKIINFFPSPIIRQYYKIYCSFINYLYSYLAASRLEQ